MLNVFDSYSRESQDLLLPMKESGFYGPPDRYLEPIAFLPDGRPLSTSQTSKREREVDAAFNEVPVPDFWEARQQVRK